MSKGQARDQKRSDHSEVKQISCKSTMSCTTCHTAQTDCQKWKDRYQEEETKVKKHQQMIEEQSNELRELRRENDFFKCYQNTVGQYKYFAKLNHDIKILEFNLKDSKKFKYTEDDLQKLRDDHKKERDEFERNFIQTLSPFL